MRTARRVVFLGVVLGVLVHAAPNAAQVAGSVLSWLLLGYLLAAAWPTVRRDLRRVGALLRRASSIRVAGLVSRRRGKGEVL